MKTQLSCCRPIAQSKSKFKYAASNQYQNDFEGLKEGQEVHAKVEEAGEMQLMQLQWFQIKYEEKLAQKNTELQELETEKEKMKRKYETLIERLKKPLRYSRMEMNETLVRI